MRSKLQAWQFWVTGVLVLLGALSLAFAGYTREHRRRTSVIGPVWYPVQSDPLSRNPLGPNPTIMEFTGTITVREGHGWQVWTAASTSRVDRGPAPTDAQLKALANWLWQHTLDYHRNQPLSPYQRSNLVGYEMLRDGVSVKEIGAVYRHLSEPCRWAGWVLVGMGLLVKGHHVQRVLCSRLRVRRIHRGFCGRCRYPFPADIEVGSVCTECGTVVHTELAEATAISREPLFGRRRKAADGNDLQPIDS